MLSANRGFTFSFLILMSLTDFSCVITLGNMYSIVLNSRENNVYAYLSLDHSGNTSNPSSLNKIATLGLRYMYFIMLRKYPSISIFLSVFIISGAEIVERSLSVSRYLLFPYIYTL